MNPIHECMSAHRTIRKYRPGELDDGIVRRAVESAQMAATSSNVQAYSLLRVRDPARRARLAELCGGQSQVAESGAFFVICGDQRRHQLLAEAAGVPFAVNLETFLIAVIDASLFAQNLVLAFESLGLGTCFIGGLRGSLPAVDQLLELPPGVLPLSGLVVGEPDEEPSRRPRLPVEAVLFEERYPDDETILSLTAAYDRTMESYYEARGKAGHNWSGGVTRSFREPKRGDLFEYYRAKGALFE
jgi:FMN reductase (NADPH)